MNTPDTLAADLFLQSLKSAGVDFFICNPGTDFPPVVEAYARHAGEPQVLPRPVLAAHETIAAAMGHGVYLASGRPAAVMLHVNVGTANAICNLVNAQRDHVPLILMAGRTPYLEAGLHGSRSSNIHWGQEMFDQAGMLREIVKWDYEWRMPQQATALARRAWEISMAHPRGPVYLSLPREVIAQPAGEQAAQHVAATPPPVASDAVLRELADRLLRARSPLVITTAAGRDRAAVQALVRLVEARGMPVVEHFGRHLNFPQDHPWHAGFDPTRLLAEADFVLVLESEVPWIPARMAPRDDAWIVHLAFDPLFHRYPMRGFRADLQVGGDVAAALTRLAELVAASGTPPTPAPRRAAPALPEDDRLTPETVSAAVQAILDEDTVVFNEYTLQRTHCCFTRPGSYFGHAPAGGLGWGFGAALGYKLAAPEKFVVAVLGDGAYIFANPIAAHAVAAAENLPVLVIVCDNARYGAVRRATMGMYAQGAAAEDDCLFLARLNGTPDYAEIARAHGAHAVTVHSLAELPAALQAAKAAVLGGRQALVNVRLAN